ncbi:peptidase dimerization domain-containing protein [Mesorhizobium captivum]|uniref:peptidase dimerization domain-containing protein n=1 Tax=Mesorhizobium captivum TaxID=3072319 RepID=UPI003D31B9E1
MSIIRRTIEHLSQLEQDMGRGATHISTRFRRRPKSSSLTIGTISGGEWLASIPSECRFEGRIGFCPGEMPEARAGRFENFQKCISERRQLTGCPRA